MKPRRPFATRTIAAAASFLLVGLTASACTSDTDRFCNDLRHIESLSSLITAIERRDERSITNGLDQLRKLQDIAPSEIFDDFRALVDALSATVQITLNTPDEMGTTGQVDATELTAQLEKIDAPAHNVAEFAEENCGISLNP